MIIYLRKLHINKNRNQKTEFSTQLIDIMNKDKNSNNKFYMRINNHIRIL